VDESGAYSSSYANAAGVYKAWQDWTNAHGGINGHPVAVTVMDDQSSPTVGLAAAHTLIEGDHVLAVTAEAIGTIQNLGPYATQQGTPLVGGIYVSNFGTTLGQPDVYASVATAWSEFPLALQIAKQQGKTKVGFVNLAQAGSANYTSSFVYAVQQAGLTFTKTVTVSITQPDYTAECLALKQAGTDVIGSILEVQPLEKLMDQCAAQGYHPLLIAESGEVGNEWASDSNFENAIATIPSFPWFDTSVPAIATFSQAMKQYDPTATTGAGSPIVAAEAWATMEVMGAAAKGGNVGPNSTAADFRKGLDSLDGQTFGGLTPTLKYSNGANLMPPVCDYIIQVSKGAFHLLNGGNRMCAPYSIAQATFNISQTGHP
jgi:branched-chain amino acid transport system substrate-binding protein